MKRNRRRLESLCRQNPMENNLKAVKIASNLYLAKVDAVRKAYFAVRISKASNQQVELFCIVSRIGYNNWPPSSISCDQFAATISLGERQ